MPTHTYPLRRFAFCVLSFAFLLFLGATPTPYQQALTPRTLSFPQDHGRHDGFKIEWWYFTGTLRDASNRRFGYQLTFFRSLLAPDSPKRQSPWATTDLFFAHAALADIQDQQFLYHDALSRGRPGLASASDQTLDVHLQNWSALLKDNIIHLAATTPDFSLALNCTAQKPIPQGPGALSQKGPNPGQASYYYSMPTMPTTGTITLANNTYTLTGLSWFDHEFSSNVLTQEQTGWDWFSLQLADGRALMLYRLRNKDGTDTRFGSLASPDGSVTYLKPTDIHLTPANPAKAPSGAIYPQTWTLLIPTLNNYHPFTVQTLLKNAELQTPNSTNVTYYEGPIDAVDAPNKKLGEGYLEMTGYSPTTK